MQEPIYSAKDEQELMSRLWSPALKDNPLAWVMYTFPWGQKGTPLEHFAGPRKWQKEVLTQLGEHIKENNGLVDFNTFRMATSSGRGIGKSALVSWIVIWMLSTRIGSTSIVSANSESQLRSITWAEITKWLSMAINSHWFEVSATRVMPAKWITELVERDLKMGTRYWGAEGRLWSAENPDAYAGVHNFAGVLLVFDEASGIDDSIWSVAAGFFTENTPNRFWLAFSNPRRNSGYFYETFHGKRDFWKNKIVDARTVEGGHDAGMAAARGAGPVFQLLEGTPVDDRHRQARRGAEKAFGRALPQVPQQAAHGERQRQPAQRLLQRGKAVCDAGPVQVGEVAETHQHGQPDEAIGHDRRHRRFGRGTVIANVRRDALTKVDVRQHQSMRAEDVGTHRRSAVRACSTTCFFC